MQYNRGGRNISVGDIGRFKCLRQHLLYPGESLKTRITGRIKLSALRQRTRVYPHVHLAAYASPLRHYWDEFPQFLQEGISTVRTIPTLTGTDWTDSPDRTSQMGVGRIRTDPDKWWAQHPINIWNEWYRFPDDTKVSVDTPPATFFDSQGKECVNLQSALTRVRDTPTFDALEYQVPSATVLDVRDLVEYQKRFNQAAISDWVSVDRYNQFMQDIYGMRAKGANEVDKVPIRLQRSTELNVKARDLYAVDAAGLGEIATLNEFNVDHTFDNFMAMEHMIVAYVMVIRFAPIPDTGVQPMISSNDYDYETIQGDPVVLSGQRPISVKARELGTTSASVIGYLPHAWQAREGFHQIDEVVNTKQNFPLLNVATQTAAGFRNAAAILNPFRSTALKDFQAELNMQCDVNSRIPSAGTSITAGADDARKPKGNHPIGRFTS